MAMTMTEKIKQLEAENEELKTKAEPLDRALVLLDILTRAVESKDDMAEDSAGPVCRAFLSKIGYKTPV